ncbi:MAG: PHP domain-containing protein [Candidatus Cloacimonadaceae bacterium]|jgi:PHP family Zn ribbon phosphoesterase|nr:PHP domain-containing protein [Candidatus Cloacimonadota bacterium]MCB5258786.1 PHP domain-containing protein [Candidatus Cloacimonadota bacterium]MDY0111902.1 PHP domain-containing protein [Candidatus Syntrophosphaera sp.]
MQWFTADLHIHSVLSPCGGLEMSPQNLITQVKKKGIDWMALTDHNSLANCPAYATVAEREGVYFTWGVEVQTSEEIHLLIYFDSSEKGKKFGELLYNSLLPIDNNPDFFGDQVIIDENENILQMEPKALINSSIWNLNTTVETAMKYGGFCVPAHIDAEVNSIISQLGFIPDNPEFNLFSITARANTELLISRYPSLKGKSFLRASDAHYLSDVGSGTSKILVKEPSAYELAQAALKAEGRKIVV